MFFMRLKFCIIVTRRWNLGKVICKRVCYTSKRCNFFVTILQMFDCNWWSFSRDFINNVPYFLKRCAAVNGRNKTMPWLTSGCFYSSSAFGPDDFVVMTYVDIEEMDMGWVHPWVGLGWMRSTVIFHCVLFLLYYCVQRKFANNVSNVNAVYDWVHTIVEEESWASIGLEFGVQWVGVFTAAWQSVNHNRKPDVYFINSVSWAVCVR